MVRRSGVGALGCLVYLVVLACIVYFGSPFGRAYLDYYRFEDAMKQEARFAMQRSDPDIQSRLKVFADSLGLPKSASAVRISRGREKVTILGSYTKSVTIPLLGPRKVHFKPKAEASF